MAVPEYDHEKWVELYKSAMLEIKHSLMSGRIMEARAEIVARIEQLRGIPGLHAQEHQAIEDALGGLRMLEQEEIRFEADQQNKLAQAALEKLGSIEPTVARLKSQQSDED